MKLFLIALAIAVVAVAFVGIRNAAEYSSPESAMKRSVERCYETQLKGHNYHCAYEDTAAYWGYAYWEEWDKLAVSQPTPAPTPAFSFGAGYMPSPEGEACAASINEGFSVGADGYLPYTWSSGSMCHGSHSKPLKSNFVVPGSLFFNGQYSGS